MAMFDFITDEDFRHSLEKDFEELRTSHEASNWKCVHVLAGSIVEALLIDQLISAETVTRDKALKLTLNEAIQEAKREKIITERTANLSSVVQSYRNLIHPGRVIRLEEGYSKNTADVALSLVSIVVTEVTRSRRQSFGYTAEQIVSKLERDSQASTILAHLLREVSPSEIERLLTKVLPERYIALNNDFESPPGIEKRLADSFHTCFKHASDETKKKTLKRIVKTLKEESGSVVMSYSSAFLSGSYLVYADENDRGLLKQHILGRLKETIDSSTLRAIDGLYAFLDKKEIAQFFDPVIRVAASHTSSALRNEAASVIDSSYNSSPKPIDDSIKERLVLWRNAYQERKRIEEYSRVQDIIDGLDAIPF